MVAKIVNGREIAQSLRQEVSAEIKKLVLKNKIQPTITTVCIGSNPASTLYLKLRDNACKEVGIVSNHLILDEKTSEKKILGAINKLNIDQIVHGIFIQYPVPSHLSQEKLMNAVTPMKDVEGFNAVNLGRTIIGDEHLVPCTPQAVLTILDYEHVPLKGKDVVIVNHSNIVGKPLAALLLNRNATVSICHVFTNDLKMYTTRAEILITAAGVPNLITKDHVNNHASIVDVAVVETKKGICGDVDFQNVKDKVALLTPVPGGVGPVTIACSLKNMVKTYKNSIESV